MTRHFITFAFHFLCFYFLPRHSAFLPVLDRRRILRTFIHLCIQRTADDKRPSLFPTLFTTPVLYNITSSSLLQLLNCYPLSLCLPRFSVHVSHCILTSTLRTPFEPIILISYGPLPNSLYLGILSKSRFSISHVGTTHENVM